MAKQTFTTGQVLTAAQMTSLQQTAMQGGAASAKTASYTLVAADAGTAISMSNASATTITVNTGLFAAGDTVQITNLGAGVCTITAGTATVNTAASLALAQYESGTLDFTSASAAIFIKGAGAAPSAGGMTLISTTTLSAATAISFTSIPTTYKSLRFVFIACRSTSSYWNATFNNDTAGNYQTQASAAATTGGNSTNSSAGAGATNGRLGIIPATYDGQNNGSCNGYMQIDNYTSTTLQRTGVWQCAGYDGTYFCVTGAFNYNSTGTAITRVDFVRGSTQTINGEIQLWGIA